MAPHAAPPGFTGIVRENARWTLGLVIAASGPCLEIQRQEIAYVRRHLKPVRPEALVALELPPSWMAGVLLCPGDSTDAIAPWVASLDAAELPRVRLYVHRDADLVTLLSAWYEAGLDDPPVTLVHDFAAFHKVFGWDLVDWIYRDAAGAR